MSRVLLIDDEPRFCQATSETLRQRGHDVSTANGLAAARELLHSANPELILLDLILPDGNGLELFEHIDGMSPNVVIITGHPSIKSHIRNLAGPSVSYLTKPVDITELVRIVEELTSAKVEESVTPDDPSRHFGLLCGESHLMQAVYQSIEQFGPTEATVLIEGESGTGKELVARALHRVSERKGRFVAANCGGLSSELVASELFGHEKGSFTGATRRHTGVFERANDGTLFLDEIAEMPLDMQTYLLRSLDSGTIVRVGAEEEIQVRTRLVAATNKKPLAAVREGTLREDIYYRLSEFVIALPPLRQRSGDIDLLVNRFVADLNAEYGADKSPSTEFLERCRTYSWPGNVRELKHMVHRAFLLADGDQGKLGAEDGFDRAGPLPADSAGIEPGRPIRDVERELIMKTLEHYNGNKKAAARTLGVSLKTLYNRLNEYRVTSRGAGGHGDERRDPERKTFDV
jgi:two-component system response regulator HydG